MNDCICGSSGGRLIDVIERQMGIGGRFPYIECGTCGSLRIQQIPADLSRYYPSSYYSFSSKDDWRFRLQRFAMRLAMTPGFPALSSTHFHYPAAVQKMRLRPDERVLDVGSGVAGAATLLRRAGNLKASGIDPFISADVFDKHGIAVRKGFLQDIEGQWDVIMFNHSLEHIFDPLSELRLAKQRLSFDGRIIVRIPVIAWAYREYGPDWFQIDAPRHLFVPSRQGMEALVTRAGLRITAVRFDSNYTQFWHSENYRSGLGFIQPGTKQYWSMLTRTERWRLNRKAKFLNRMCDGDQAVFFLA